MAVQAGQGPLAGLSKCDWDELYASWCLPTLRLDGTQRDREERLFTKAAVDLQFRHLVLTQAEVIRRWRLP